MLAGRIAAGALWTVGARLATRLLDLAAMLIVARLLAPADFGLFALAASVLLVLNAVTDLALSDAIVQMPDPGPQAYDTAFTLGAARGLMLACAIVAVAEPFAAFYGDPRLAPILFALALIPVLRGLTSPRMAHLQRELDFRPAFYLEAVGKLAAFVASVTVSLATHSYWALVCGMVAAPLLSTLLSYRLAAYRPAFSLDGWRPIFTFSGWLTLSNAVNTINWQSDRFFIGSRLGTPALGAYTVGSDLASLPTNTPVLPIMQVLYAGFAKLAHDLERLRAAYLISQCTVIAVALPIGICAAVLARPIIAIALGPQWMASAFVVQVLAPVFALQLLTAPAHSIAMATGRTNGIFRRDLAALAVRLPAILAGLYLAGFEGVVWARVVSGAFMILLNLLMMQRILGLGLSRQLLAPWRSYASGALTALLLLALTQRLGLDGANGVGDLPLLAGLGALGLLVYAVLHLVFWALANPPVSAEAKVLGLLKPTVSAMLRRS